MVSEGHVLEDHAVVIFVEGCPAAVLALHGEYPVNGALHRLALIAAVGMLHPAEGEAYHGAVIDIGIELIIELEIPAPGLPFRIFHFPVAHGADLFLQNPVGALHHARIIGGNSGLCQREHSIGCIPDGRDARLHAESFFFLDA